MRGKVRESGCGASGGLFRMQCLWPEAVRVGLNGSQVNRPELATDLAQPEMEGEGLMYRRKKFTNQLIMETSWRTCRSN